MPGAGIRGRPPSRGRARFGPGQVEDASALARAADRQVAALTEALREHFGSDRPRRWRRGFRSGRRVDVRALLKREADREFDRVWMRRETPANLAEAHVVILVDLSGSMAGPEIAHAAAAVGAIALAFSNLDRLEWRIFGFQDVLIPIARKGGSFDPDVIRRHMIEEVENRRAGGNNQAGYNDDGPSVLEASEHLPAAAGLRRVLMVLSDGRPAGRHSTPEDLTSAVEQVSASGIDLIGLGIGPGTRHVTEYYPNARAEVPLDRLAGTIAEILDEALR